MHPRGSALVRPQQRRPTFRLLPRLSARCILQPSSGPKRARPGVTSLRAAAPCDARRSHRLASPGGNRLPVHSLGTARACCKLAFGWPMPIRACRGLATGPGSLYKGHVKLPLAPPAAEGPNDRHHTTRLRGQHRGFAEALGAAFRWQRPRLRTAFGGECFSGDRRADRRKPSKRHRGHRAAVNAGPAGKPAGRDASGQKKHGATARLPPSLASAKPRQAVSTPLGAAPGGRVQ